MHNSWRSTYNREWNHHATCDKVAIHVSHLRPHEHKRENHLYSIKPSETEISKIHYGMHRYVKSEDNKGKAERLVANLPIHSTGYSQVMVPSEIDRANLEKPNLLHQRYDDFTKNYEFSYLKDGLDRSYPYSRKYFGNEGLRSPEFYDSTFRYHLPMKHFWSNLTIPSIKTSDALPDIRTSAKLPCSSSLWPLEVPREILPYMPKFLLPLWISFLPSLIGLSSLRGALLLSSTFSASSLYDLLFLAPLPSQTTIFEHPLLPSDPPRPDAVPVLGNLGWPLCSYTPPERPLRRGEWEKLLLGRYRLPLARENNKINENFSIFFEIFEVASKIHFFLQKINEKLRENQQNAPKGGWRAKLNCNGTVRQVSEEIVREAHLISPGQQRWGVGEVEIVLVGMGWVVDGVVEVGRGLEDYN